MLSYAIRIALALLFLLGSSFVKAQEEDLNLSGYTKDSNGTLPFTHAYLKSARLGVISDINGRFTLRVPTEFDSDTLVFSHIGYFDLEIAINEMLDRGTSDFVLLESSMTLQEVVVVNKQSFLEEAFEPFLNSNKSDDVFNRRALFGFIQLEQGRYTSFEEFAVTMSYTKEDGWPTEIGISVDAQRKGYDYSKFPRISSHKQREGIQGPFYTGRSILEFLFAKASEKDFEKMEISEIYTLEGEQVLVYSEIGTGRDYLYHISESTGRIFKFEIVGRNRATYWHTSKFNNSSYSNYFFRSNSIYSFNYTNDTPEVIEMDSRSTRQYLNRLTGVTEISLEDITRVHFLGSEELSNESYKAKDLFERPIFLEPNEAFWSKSETLVWDYDLRDLESELSLSEQFALSGNDLVFKNAISGSSLEKSDLKRTNESGDIVSFLQTLESNNYSPSKDIRLEWNHVSELIKHVADTTIISRFPRNVKSKFYVPEATLGVISMWLIESIRMNEANKKPTGWFASALPVLKDQNDLQKDKEKEDGRGFFVPVNTKSKQDEAVNHFKEWWKEASTLDSKKASKIPIFPKEMEWF